MTVRNEPGLARLVGSTGTGLLSIGLSLSARSASESQLSELTLTTHQPYRHPTIEMANVYEAFCTTLQLAHQEELSPLELVDEEAGLIARYAQLCQERYAFSSQLARL